MNHFDVVNLTKLMALTEGRSEIKIGLIDGPVVMSHPDLESKNISEVPGRRGACSNAGSTACMHGTFVAGILSGKKNSQSPSICPGCTMLVSPIFTEINQGEMPSAAPRDLATAILECIEAGSNLINLSIALVQPSKGQYALEEALDYAAQQGTIVIAAAGNQGTVGSSVITHHPGVIPVVACDLWGIPIDQSNLGNSIGRRGLRAPGTEIISLSTEGGSTKMGGTSVSAPFVTGAIALIWSQFLDSNALELKSAIMQAHPSRRSIVPPLLDAWSIYQFMIKSVYER
jgi:subtilisin family serine protease